MDTMWSTLISRIISCGIRHEEIKEQDYNPLHIITRLVQKCLTNREQQYLANFSIWVIDRVKLLSQHWNPLWTSTLTPGESSLGWGSMYPWTSLTSSTSDSKSSSFGLPGWYNCDIVKYICINAILERYPLVWALMKSVDRVLTSFPRTNANLLQTGRNMYEFDSQRPRWAIALDQTFPALGRRRDPCAYSRLS